MDRRGLGEGIYLRSNNINIDNVHLRIVVWIGKAKVWNIRHGNMIHLKEIFTLQLNPNETQTRHLSRPISSSHNFPIQWPFSGIQIMT